MARHSLTLSGLGATPEKWARSHLGGNKVRTSGFSTANHAAEPGHGHSAAARVGERQRTVGDKVRKTPSYDRDRAADHSALEADIVRQR